MQTPKFDNIKKYFSRKKPTIQEVVREATAGGIVFRHGKKNGIEFLLIQDPKGRWSIPKGHIEPGETAQETAIREIGEEAGLFEIEPICWLGKTHFRYRRLDTLVLMTTQIYLIKVKTSGEEIKKEDFYANIKWFEFNEALDVAEYEDIGRLMLLAKRRIRERGL
jgi:8-oxo-dGTP pyrophosphatase MutT (NUDIX family)